VLNNTKHNRLLLLEDEPVIGRIMKRVLTADGFEVDVAENGLIARQKIEAKNHYDIFIFDIRTPVISGMQLYEYLEGEHPDLTGRVIFATGDYVNTVTRTFLQRVNRPFLAKPYTPAQIKNIIQQVLLADCAVAEK
jgi:DNA-binding NtrC family response regulator